MDTLYFKKKKINCLNHELLQLFPYLSEVIYLSETQIKNNLYIKTFLQGYKPLIHADSLTNAGGIGIYTSKTYLFLFAPNEK